MGKIEPSGCTQRRELRRGTRVGILVLLAILLFSGIANATYPEPFYNFTEANYSELDSGGRLIYVSSYDGMTQNPGAVYNGNYQRLTQSKTFEKETVLEITIFGSTYLANTMSFYIDDMVTPYWSNAWGFDSYYTFSATFSPGTHTIRLENRFTQTSSWSITHPFFISNYNDITPPPTVTVSCPVGWCFLSQNYSSKTLQQLDDMFSTDTVQGFYNNSTKKYVNHRTGYAFNENQTVTQKQGIYYYFTSAQDMTITIPASHSINLVTGWNMIGNMQSSPRTLAALKTSIGVTATQASYYDKNLKAWVAADSQSVPAMENFMVYVSSNSTWVN